MRWLRRSGGAPLSSTPDLLLFRVLALWRSSLTPLRDMCLTLFCSGGAREMPCHDGRYRPVKNGIVNVAR